MAPKPPLPPHASSTDINAGCRKLLAQQDAIYRKAINLYQRVCLGLLAALMTFFTLRIQ